MQFARLQADLERALAVASIDVDAYVWGKTEMLIAVLAGEGFTDGELARIREANRNNA